jgi:hypothetical protein
MAEQNLKGALGTPVFPTIFSILRGRDFTSLCLASQQVNGFKSIKMSSNLIP